MELRKVSVPELWSLLDDCQDLYNRYVILTTDKITPPLPALSLKTLPLSWIFQPENKDLIKCTSYTSDEGWYCTVIHGLLSLTLNKALYTECGLQCTRHASVPDLYTFTCDLNTPLSKHNTDRLTYCFKKVLRHEYSWMFGVTQDQDQEPRAEDQQQEEHTTVVQLPGIVAETDHIVDIVEQVGAALLQVQAGAHDSAVNSFTYCPDNRSCCPGNRECCPGEEGPVLSCHVYTADTLVTGKELVRLFSDKRGIRFITLYTLPTTVHTTKHITCLWSGQEEVYLLQYDVR